MQMWVTFTKISCHWKLKFSEHITHLTANRLTQTYTPDTGAGKLLINFLYLIFE